MRTMRPIDRQRHIEIGKRLREFRESLRIPRTSLARWIGISSDRLASYEGGRASLPCDVFQAISDRLNLNPYWLLLGAGTPRLPYKFRDSRISVGSPKARFSDVFDSITKVQTLTPLQLEADTLVRSTYQQVWAFLEAAREWENKNQWPSLLPPLQESLRAVLLGSESVVRLLYSVLPKKDLTALTRDRKHYGVLTNGPKSELDALLDRLKLLTSMPGAKTALAADLGVPLPRVSEWINKRFAPSAETVLRILRWVENAEHQSKSSSSGEAPLEQKTRRKESISHEKHPSSRKRK